MKNFFYVIIAVAIIATTGYFVVRDNKNNSGSEKQAQNTETTDAGAKKQEGKNVEGDILMDGSVATIYYGDGCPHCTVIEKWLVDNGYLPNVLPVKQSDVDSWIGSAKVKFNLKEVWYNKTNSAELSSNAAALGIEDNQVGVPFLYDSVNKKSYVGETEIKKFFQSV